MQYTEIREIQSLNISEKIPEEHLILMFPFTYATYRTITAGVFGPFPGYLASDPLLSSFKSFLSFMGPVKEDTRKAH